jgi:hypothetical protein
MREEVAFGQVQVGAADATRRHSYSDLVADRLGNRALAELEGPVVDWGRMVDPPRLHAGGR